jgi:hypothetical protein
MGAWMDGCGNVWARQFIERRRQPTCNAESSRLHASVPSSPLCLQRHDLFFSSAATGGGRRRGRVVKPNVVLASYETVLKDRGLFTVS